MCDFRIVRMTGDLGRSVKSWQKTLKRKAGEIPWKEVRVNAFGTLFVSFSFDGRTYGDEMIVESQEYVLLFPARAVRVRAARSNEFVSYIVTCRY